MGDNDLPITDAGTGEEHHTPSVEDRISAVEDFLARVNTGLLGETFIKQV